MRGGAVELPGQRIDGHARHHVEQAGLEAGQHIGLLGGHRVDAQGAHHVGGAAVAGPDEDLHLAVVVNAVARLLGKETHPAKVAPAEDFKALIAKFLFQARPELLEDVIKLVERAEHHRQELKAADGVFDLRKARDGEHRGLNLPDAHAADHVGLAAHRAVGEDGELNLVAGGLLPRVAHLLEGFVGRGVLGGERG